MGGDDGRWICPDASQVYEGYDVRPEGESGGRIERVGCSSEVKGTGQRNTETHRSNEEESQQSQYDVVNGVHV